jgi:membrane-bound ClpP family serine protease
MEKMTIRLRFTILATMVEEMAVALIVLLVLPRFGIHIPRPALIAIMAGLAVYGVFSYRMVSRALSKKPMAGLPAMVCTRGRVIKPLAPKGLVKINNELWEATSADCEIGIDEEITVVEQRGLKLVVRKSGSGDLE